MNDVKCPDGGGCSITLSCVDGRYLTPGNNSENWNAILEFSARADDVFICSYPKSGFHWLWEITSMLRKGDATPLKDFMEFNILDFLPANMLPELDKRPSPRTFTTHRYPDELPKSALEQKCKIVYLLRDPKDICVSFYHHLTKMTIFDYEGEFENYMPLFLEGKVPFNSWCENIIKWHDIREKKPEMPIIIIYYEDMKKDPVSEIKRLASFLEIDACDDLVNAIAANTSFSTMKTAKESLDNPFAAYFKTGKEIMYRKGEIGDWKNNFSEEKSKEFDDYIKAKLADIDLTKLMDPSRYSCLQ